jgi:hypothetical protein
MWFFGRNYRLKIDESDESDDDMYIMHVKKYAISTCSELERWCDI